MSNWQPAGRMWPLSLFCAARIGIFIILQFNPFAYGISIITVLILKISTNLSTYNIVKYIRVIFNHLIL